MSGYKGTDMIDLTKPIRRKGWNQHKATVYGPKYFVSPDSVIEAPAWLTREELELYYENIPEPRKPREFHILTDVEGFVSQCTETSSVRPPGRARARAIEWPVDAPLPDWPEGYD